VKKKAKFVVKHAKSSAALISLGIHAVLIVVAISFVAVTVITKDDLVFEAKPVNRPKMQLKKLQVPVNIKKKKTQKPKLRKRIVVQPKLNQSVPDIKMPEITGVKGGMGSAGDGLGGAGSLGFTMPEINIFGIKGKGEKIFLILDSTPYMMYDEMGGIPAYTIIKNELIRIVEELPPTALFNVAVYGRGTQTLFPDMVSANDANAAKVKEWLSPLNAVSKGMGDRDYGMQTLGPGGIKRDDDIRPGKFAQAPRPPGWWGHASLLAMQQQADTVFLLAGRWGNFTVITERGDSSHVKEWWDGPQGKKRKELQKKAAEMLKKENEERRKRGQPPRVLTGPSLLGAYFPNAPRPPGVEDERFSFKPEHFAAGYNELQVKNTRTVTPTKSGISRKKKASSSKFSFNVIHFVKKGEDSASNKDANFHKLVNLCNGEYKMIGGLDAVQSYVTSSSAE